MHRSLLVFDYELVVDAFRVFQKGAHDVSARHAPRASSRSGIARTHRTGKRTARASRGSVDAPNRQPARLNSAAPCPEHALRVGIP
jgi:hypothetical protein